MGHDFNENDQRLIKRYLVWCYKTTKEALDKIDRYFTQDVVDGFILAQLKQDDAYAANAAGSKEFHEFVDDFEGYMAKKLAKAKKQRYTDAQAKAVHPQYLYWQKRFAAIEATIIHFLGTETLDAVQNGYEAEMTQRILQARDHT